MPLPKNVCPVNCQIKALLSDLEHEPISAREVVNLVMGGNWSKLSEMGSNCQKWVKNGSKMSPDYQ